MPAELVVQLSGWPARKAHHDDEPAGVGRLDTGVVPSRKAPRLTFIRVLPLRAMSARVMPESDAGRGLRASTWASVMLWVGIPSSGVPARAASQLVGPVPEAGGDRGIEVRGTWSTAGSMRGDDVRGS